MRFVRPYGKASRISSLNPRASQSLLREYSTFSLSRKIKRERKLKIIVNNFL